MSVPPSGEDIDWLHAQVRSVPKARLLLKQGERTKHEEHDLVRRARRTQNSDSICARPTSAASLVSIAETLRPPVQRYSPTAIRVAPSLTMQELLAAKSARLMSV
jgi:hypothetical protein